MKSIASIKNQSLLVRGALAALLSAAVLAGSVISLAKAEGSGSTGNPGVLPPQSKSHGKSYGEWAAVWWQWVLSVPADSNPLTDTTGEFAGEGQEGPVWFLAGTFGNSVERSFNVPAGKTIFMPVFNCIFGAGVFDCDPTVPGVPCVVCDLQDTAAENTEAIAVLEVTIDGQPLTDVRQYRARSPEAFSIEYPENSLVGVPAGTYFPQVADGYWLILEPLAKGQHEVVVRVRGETPYFGLVDYEIIHNITVTPGK